MDERDIIEGLRGLDLAEPELGFDPDEVADRAAKRLRTRRAVIGTIVGTLVVTGVAMGTALTVTSSDLPVAAGVSPASAVNLGAHAEEIKLYLAESIVDMVPGAREVTVTTRVTDELTADIRYVDQVGPVSLVVSIAGPATSEARLASYLRKVTVNGPMRQAEGDFYEEVGSNERAGAAFMWSNKMLVIMHNEANGRYGVPLDKVQVYSMVKDVRLGLL